MSTEYANGTICKWKGTKEGTSQTQKFLNSTGLVMSMYSNTHLVRRPVRSRTKINPSHFTDICKHLESRKTVQFLLFMSCHHCLIGEYQRFGGECCLHLQGQSKTGWWRGERTCSGSTQEGCNGNTRIAVKMEAMWLYGINPDKSVGSQLWEPDNRKCRLQAHPSV